MEDVYELKPRDYITADFLFLGGSMDGQTKHGTTAKNVIVTLKNKEQYKFLEPNIMKFIGIKEEVVNEPVKLSWKQWFYQKVIRWINS